MARIIGASDGINRWMTVRNVLRHLDGSSSSQLHKLLKAEGLESITSPDGTVDLSRIPDNHKKLLE